MSEPTPEAMGKALSNRKLYRPTENMVSCGCGPALAIVYVGPEGNRWVKIKSRAFALDTGEGWQVLVECRRCRSAVLMFRPRPGSIDLLALDPMTRGVVAD
jgi:hypothetical protein